MKSLVKALLAFGRTESFARFYLGLGAGVVGAAALWTAAWCASLGKPLNSGERELETWYQAKDEAARRATSPTKPKIVLLGGSNVLYGIDAAQIVRKNKFPTVNYGTHAALNLDFLLWRASKVLNPGDVVVLSLEWEHFHRNPFELNQVSAPYLVAAEPAYLPRLPWRTLAGLILTSGWDRILLPLRFLPREDARIHDAFWLQTMSFTLTLEGDVMGKRPEDKGPAQQRSLDAVTIDPNLVLAAPQALTAPPWRRIAEFIRSCREQSIAVWIAFPALMDDPAYRSPAAKRVYRAFEHNFETLGAGVLTRQISTLYGKDALWDTIYHVHFGARMARTNFLIYRMRKLGILPPAPPVQP